MGNSNPGFEFYLGSAHTHTRICLLQAGHWLRTLTIENSSMCGSGWSHDLLRAHVNFSLKINTWGEYWQNASAKNYLKRLTHRFECCDFAGHLLHHSVILLLQHLVCFHGTHAVTIIAYWGICIHVGGNVFPCVRVNACVLSLDHHEYLMTQKLWMFLGFDHLSS